MPSRVVLRYGLAKNDNIAVMITPDGEIVYTYEKTISWYPTESDGIIKTVRTLRQCNQGVSIAADYRGSILASQDFFTTEDRVMLSDVPVKGVKTLYEETGDWLFLSLMSLSFLSALLFGRR